MTVKNAIDELKIYRPGHAYTDAQVVSWLSELDGKLYQDVVSWHEDTDDVTYGPYNATEDQDTELMVASPHTDVYRYYLQAMVDYNNNETDRYTNSMIMYNTARADYSAWYNRTHLPKQSHYIKV